MIPIAIPFMLFRSRMGGPNGRALKAWVAEHRPELDAELGPLKLDQVRERLNEITGCNVDGDEPIERGSAVFLEALKAQHSQSSEVAP